MPVLCAETDDAAERLAVSADLAWLRFHRREFTPLPSPEEALAYDYTPRERDAAREHRARHVIGTPDVVRARIAELVMTTGADEVMVNSMIHGHADRLRSYKLLIG